MELKKLWSSLEILNDDRFKDKNYRSTSNKDNN